MANSLDVDPLLPTMEDIMSLQRLLTEYSNSLEQKSRGLVSQHQEVQVQIHSCLQISRLPRPSLTTRRILLNTRGDTCL